MALHRNISTKILRLKNLVDKFSEIWFLGKYFSMRHREVMKARAKFSDKITFNSKSGCHLFCFQRNNWVKSLGCGKVKLYAVINCLFCGFLIIGQFVGDLLNQHVWIRSIYTNKSIRLRLNKSLTSYLWLDIPLDTCVFLARYISINQSYWN